MPLQPPKIDPFKPTQPRIPGVTDAPAARQAEPSPEPEPSVARERDFTFAQIPAKWIASAVVAAAVFGLAVRWWSHRPAGTTASDASVPATILGSAPSAAPKEPKLPAGPGPIATTEELAKAWSAKKFSFRNSLSGEMWPAMVVHLPSGEYWAFSLQEPFGNCTLEYVTDTKKLGHAYGYSTEHPMVVDPCNRSVFDLLRYGNGPTGLVRGEVEQGPAIRPPLAIEVRIEGNKVVVVRME